MASTNPVDPGPVLAAMPASCVVIDGDGRVVYVNALAARLAGWASIADGPGRDVLDAFPLFAGTPQESALRQAAAGAPQRIDTHFPAPVDAWYELIMQPRRVEGEPGGVTILGFDVSGRQRDGRRSRRILESMPVGYINLDDQWRYAEINTSGAEMSGRPADELLGGNVWELYPDAVGSPFENIYRRVATTGVEETLEAYYPAPLDRWFEVRVAPDHDGGVLIFLLDVTERRLAQDQLTAAAAHDRSVAQTLQRVSSCRNLELGALLDAVLDDLVGGQPSDDAAVMAIRIAPDRRRAEPIHPSAQDQPGITPGTPTSRVG